MSNTLIRWITLAVILSLIGYFTAKRLGWLDVSPKADTSTEEASVTPPLPVSYQVLSPAPLKDNLTVSGSLEAAESVDLSSEIAGKIVGIYFKEGTYVKKGQRLVKLDDADLQAELTKVSFQRDLAQQQANRRQQLLEKGGLSQEEYDEAQTELNTLEAEISLLEVRISKTTITAPFSGEIGFRYVSEGSYVSPGTRIAQLVKTQPIKLSFSVPEAFATRIEVGTPLSFTVGGVGDTLSANVYALDPSINPETRTLTAKALASNPGGKLSPGAFATLTLEMANYPDALMVPTRAIVPEANVPFVYQYKNGNATSVAVSTGIRQANRIQILKGLQPGDTIITSGLIQMSNGKAVSLR